MAEEYISIHIAGITVTFEKSVGALGDEEGLFGLPGFELMIAIPAIAFVARRYRTN